MRINLHICDKNDDFGTRLFKRRENLNMSVQDLADKLLDNLWSDGKNLPEKGEEENKKYNFKKTIYNWEGNKTTPTINYLPYLCSILNCDYDFLMCKIDTPYKDVYDVKEVTGLSDEAIESLKELYNNSFKKESYNLSLAAVDLILREEENSCLLWDMGMYLFGSYINGRAKEECVNVGANCDNILVHTIPLLNENSGKEWFFDIKDLKESLLLKVTHRLQNWKERIEKNK